MNLKKGWNVESSSYTMDKKVKNGERWNAINSSIVKPPKIVKALWFS
jgi:hypothetical protein